MRAPSIAIADFSGRMSRQGTARVAVQRLAKDLRRLRHEAEMAQEPWDPPHELVISFAGVAVARSGLRTLMYYTRLLVWDSLAACPARVRWQGLDQVSYPLALEAAAKGMASVELVESAPGGLVLVFGPWRRTPSRQALMDRLVERDGPACAWCGREVDPTGPDATLDHVELACRGGSYAVENLLLACLGCNGERSDSEAEAWLEHCLATGRLVRYPIVVAALARRGEALRSLVGFSEPALTPRARVG